MTLKDMRLFDIGGSGIKSIKMVSIDDINISSIEYFTNPNFIDFGKWLNDLNLLDSEAIGISMAGFIKNKDTVKLSMIANCMNGKGSGDNNNSFLAPLHDTTYCLL